MAINSFSPFISTDRLPLRQIEQTIDNKRQELTTDEKISELKELKQRFRKDSEEIETLITKATEKLKSRTVIIRGNGDLAMEGSRTLVERLLQKSLDPTVSEICLPDQIFEPFSKAFIKVLHKFNCRVMHEDFRTTPMTENEICAPMTENEICATDEWAEFREACSQIEDLVDYFPKQPG